MKAKKILAFTLSLLTLGSACGGLGSCGDKPTPGVDNSDNVINIMPLAKGYGIGWLQEVGEAFNKLYKAEGYEVIDIDGARVIIGHGWGLVRASNTGPNLTIKGEADTMENAEKILEMIKQYIEEAK